MDGKEKVLLKLIGEVHDFCKDHDIVYYLAETEKTAWSASLVMDSANIRKFLDRFACPDEDRGLEWAGNNHAILGDQIKYVDLNTAYYTQDRLVRELYMGMFISIKPVVKSSSRLAKLNRYHKHMGFQKNDDRSKLLNAAAGKMHTARIEKCKGNIRIKDVVEVDIYGTAMYAHRSSDFASDAESAWDRLVVRKKNSDAFFCDENISYKELGLEEDRKILASYEHKLDIPKIKFKRGEKLQNECIQASNASFCRFCVVTELLQKYSYDEIESLGKEPGEVRTALDDYIDRAKRLRSKKYSGYIGERFTKVINSIYPEIDTNDLYAFTPDLYDKGVKIYDYEGNLLGIYGGSDEQ